MFRAVSAPRNSPQESAKGEHPWSRMPGRRVNQAIRPNDPTRSSWRITDGFGTVDRSDESSSVNSAAARSGSDVALVAERSSLGDEGREILTVLARSGLPSEPLERRVVEVPQS